MRRQNKALELYTLKERLIAGGMALLLTGLLILGSRSHFGVSAAELNGITGDGKSSNEITASDFPLVDNIDDMGGAVLRKHRSPNNVPTRSGNYIQLTNSIAHNQAEIIGSDGTNTYARVNASADIPMAINMKQSWILKCKVRYPKDGGGGSSAVAGIMFNNKKVTAGFIMGGSKNLSNSATKIFRWSTLKDASGAGIAAAFGQEGANTALPLTEGGSEKNVVIQYNAVDGSMTCSFNGSYTASMPSAASHFRANKDNATIKFFMQHNYVNGKNGGSANYGSVRFQSFKYTDYNREITDTQLLDGQGRTITGPVGDGHTITVQHNVKAVSDNIFANLTPHNNVEFPVSGQSIKVNNKQVSTSSGDLNYLTLKSGVNNPAVSTISYKMAVASNKEYEIGDTFSISARLRDDYIWNAAANSLPPFWPSASDGDVSVTLTNDLNRKLVSKADDPNNFDYYIEPGVNKYGWSNNDIVIRMPFGGDFEKLNVDDTEYSNNACTLSQNTEKTGKTVGIFGRNGTANVTTALSAVSMETLKLDKTSPKLEIYNRKSRTLKVADANSGIQRIEWRKAGEDWKVLKDYTDDGNGATYGPASATDAQFQFGSLGTFEFKAVDYADNESDILSVDNNKPVITADDKQATWYETANGFYLLTELNVKVSDPDETLSLNDVSWTIDRAPGSAYPSNFTKITGSGNTSLPSGLPMGKYEVKLTCEDSDGNKDTVTVLLTVKSDGPPAVIRKSDNTTLPIAGSIVYKPDGTEHAVVRSQHMIMVDQDNPYSNGEIDKDEAAEEVEKLFSFVTSYAGGTISPSVKITKNGVDFTDMGISTRSEGEYIIHYQAVDDAGNSVTLELTWQVREDYYVSFDAGKGDFKDSSADYIVKVKIGTKLNQSDIPKDSEIKAPAKKTFIGWSADKKAEPGMESDPSAVTFTKDTTFYAVYADDINEDDIDDRLQALFEFETSDTENTAFAQGALTLVAANPAEGQTTASIHESQIPKIIKMPGCYLKGWILDDSGTIISTGDLCSTKKAAGTYTKVTAVFDIRTVAEQTQAELVFFSSDYKNAPLDGGDGQKHNITTVDSTTPVKIGSSIPSYTANPGYVLEGWKTSATGDQLLTEQELADLNIYGGNEISCVAYFKYDPALLDKPITFRFYSGDRQRAPLSEDNGYEVKLTSVKGAAVSLEEKQLPTVNLSDGCTFDGWQTSITGNKIISTEELCKLPVQADEEVTVMACTTYMVPEKTVTDEHDKPDKPKEPDTPEIIEKIINKPEIIEKIISNEKVADAVKAGRDHSVQFAFFSSNLSKGIIAPKNGTTIVIPVEKGGSAELGSKRLPAVRALTNHTLIGWQTSLTGSRVISTQELYKLKAADGTTVACTAVFDLADIKVLKDGTDNTDKNTTGIISNIEDEKVPLGAFAPGLNKVNKQTGGSIPDKIRSCVVHYIMMAWILISLIAMIRRIRQRKNSDYPIPTGKSDWLFAAFSVAAGILLVLVGTCILEIPLFIVEMIILTIFIIRMKIMDRKEKEKLQIIQERIESQLP